MGLCLSHVATHFLIWVCRRWDLEQFKQVFVAAGIETATGTHEGGHEMPTIEMPTVSCALTAVGL